MSNLRPGDIILSYKKAPKWNLVQQFFDWVLKRKGTKKYGKDGNFCNTNHVRIYLGKDRYGKEWAFEYTFPTAKFTIFQPWMVDPNYGQVYRTKKDYIIDGNEMFSICIGQAGSLYDLGQLFDIWLGFNRFFDFGRSNRVCSTGVRWLLEKVIRVNLFPDISLNKTLPCTFANSNEFERITFVHIERK